MFNRKHKRIVELVAFADLQTSAVEGLRVAGRNHKGEIKSLRHQLDAAQERADALQKRLDTAHPAAVVLRTEADKLEKKANGTAIARGADAEKVAKLRETAKTYRNAAMAISPGGLWEMLNRSFWNNA